MGIYREGPERIEKNGAALRKKINAPKIWRGPCD
jgi:hypothetical protein